MHTHLLLVIEIERIIRKFQCRYTADLNQLAVLGRYANVLSECITPYDNLKNCNLRFILKNWPIDENKSFLLFHSA